MSYENTKPCVQFWQRITCDEKGRVNAIDFNIAAMMSSDPEFAPGGSVGPLKGRVPWERMGALGNLVLINLQGNAIHGPPLPANLTAFPKLYEILLQGNRFNGSLPDQISTLKALKKLDVSGNQITGSIPRGITTLSNLTWLAISQNHMADVLPPELGNLTQIVKLDIGGNGFQGPMPESWGSLEKLQLLNLQKLNLNGSFPASWAGMTSLNHFIAPAAHIRGPFPSFLLALSNLSDIVLYSNELYGPLPSAAELFAPPILTAIDVSGNYLNGSVPKVPPSRSAFKFSFSTNCFQPAAGADPLLVDSSPLPPTECSCFYSSLALGEPAQAISPSSSPSSPTTSTSTSSPSSPPSPSPSNPSASLSPSALPHGAACLLALLAASLL
ncbi:hypothetical protein CLOP_g7741 [Closterium sp. NIES-67]|nr:hypothetical protein CLOP_g7741 [Closterium sp. NIES-67]